MSNLVYLCLEHHNAYDSRTSVSKNYMELEVRRYRDMLIEALGKKAPSTADDVASHEMPEPVMDTASEPPGNANEAPRWRRPWRFPLYQIADQPEYFAYTAHGSDGVCEIERIHLPNGRIAIACVDVVGNPGTSITNAAEGIADQVCARFGIPQDRLVWLEYYADAEPDEWRIVRFTFDPAAGFSDPVWTKMTPPLWRNLRLAPRVPAPHDGYRLTTRLTKKFRWPPEDGDALLSLSDGD